MNYEEARELMYTQYEFKGTKGKWYTHVSPQEHRAWIGSNEKYFIAEIIGSDRDMQQIEANARLIASAPELLEAAINVLDVSQYNRGEEIPEEPYDAVFEHLRKIVNKVLGKEEKI